MPQRRVDSAASDVEFGARRSRSKYHYKDVAHRPRITSNPGPGTCLSEDDADDAGDLQKDLFKERVNPATGVGGSFSVSINSNNTLEDPPIQHHEPGAGSWRRRKFGNESGARPGAPMPATRPTWSALAGYPTGATIPVAEPPPISLEENFVVAGAGSILKRRQPDGRLPDNEVSDGGNSGGAERA